MNTAVRFLLVVAVVAPVAVLAARQTPAPGPLVTPLRKSGIYAVGERAGWVISWPVSAGGSAPKIPYVLKRNNQDVIRTGELDLAKGSVRVEEALDQPSMLTLTLSPGTARLPNSYGAAIAPTQLAPVHPRPADFDAFWARKIAGLRAIPENPVVTAGTSYKPEVDYATVRMDHVNGTHVYGQIARPKRPGKYPALLLLQWASPPYPLDKSWVIERAAQGFLAFNIEPHDVPTDAPRSFYQNLPTAIKNYASIGQEDREQSYFVEMYLRDVRAVDYLTKLPDWDGKTIIVMGTSMGGQQSLCVAGLHPKITHLIVNEPAGCDLNAGQHGRQEGYPFFPVNNPKVMATAPYVDAINFASRIHARSLVAMGFVDDIAPPAGIWTAFNLIQGPKEAVPMVDSPHNNLATPEQQRPWSDRSEAWLRRLARGETVP